MPMTPYEHVFTCLQAATLVTAVIYAADANRDQIRWTMRVLAAASIALGAAIMLGATVTAR